MATPQALQRLNGIISAEAISQLMTLCGSTRWSAAVATGRPYRDVAALTAAMHKAFDLMTVADWLEAFKHHPRIGDVSKLRERFAATAELSAEEQHGISGAAEATLQALAQGNVDYEARFGHVFLICATGKSAAEMLATLQARIGNSAAAELVIASGEQRKITALRFKKWMNE